MSLPSCSVVIPVFNARALLPRALASIRESAGIVREIVVVDDGSADGGPERLSALPGVPMRVVRQDNRGAGAARNRGVVLASGDLIAFLDADDEWLPGKLAAQIELLTRCPEAALAYGQMVDVSAGGERGAVWPEAVCVWPGQESLLGDWAALRDLPPTSTVVVRRAAFVEAGGFLEGAPTAEDLDLWVRLRAIGPFVGLARVVALRHRRAESLTSTHAAQTQYLRYLDVVRRRRAWIACWAGPLRARGLASVRARLALLHLRAGCRRAALTQAALSALTAHAERRLAVAVGVEAVLGGTLFLGLRRILRGRRASAPLNESSGGSRPGYG